LHHDFYNLGSATIRNITDLISTSTFSVVDGGILEAFESKVSALFGHHFGVATCNGTAAIHLALFAIGLEPGQEVIVPTYAFHAMVTPILQLGASPVFCDIDEDTLTIDVEYAKSLVSARTRAVMVLHPWGNPAHMRDLKRFANQHQLYLISDASHAHGATWSGNPLGMFSDVLCASFGKGKLITGGELGIATTDDPHLRDRMLLYGHVNRVPQAYLTDRYKDIDNAVGIKYRPHPFALQLALDQLESYPERNRRLLINVNELIGELHRAGLETQHTFTQSGRVFWKVIIMAEPAVLDRLRRKAAAAGLIVERNHYQPLLHECSVLTRYYGLVPQRFAVAEGVAARIAQIDALQLWDRTLVDRYAAVFRSLRQA
jgi:perosamine synthetase